MNRPSELPRPARPSCRRNSAPTVQSICPSASCRRASACERACASCRARRSGRARSARAWRSVALSVMPAGDRRSWISNGRLPGWRPIVRSRRRRSDSTLSSALRTACCDCSAAIRLRSSSTSARSPLRTRVWFSVTISIERRRVLARQRQVLLRQLQIDERLPDVERQRPNRVLHLGLGNGPFLLRHVRRAARACRRVRTGSRRARCTRAAPRCSSRSKPVPSRSR